MSYKSQRGFFYDLSRSPHRITIKNTVFVFPSEFRLKRFESEIQKEKERIKAKAQKLGLKFIYNNLEIAHKAYSIVQPTQQLILEVDSDASDPLD